MESNDGMEYFYKKPSQCILETKRYIAVVLALFAFILSFAMPVHSETGGSIASGIGVKRIVPLRLTLSQSFETVYSPDPERIWPFKVYAEASYYYLGRSNCNGSNPPYWNTHLTGGTLGGVLRFVRDPFFFNAHLWPYIDAGLGVAWLSHKQIAGRKLGMNFQVESKLGCGFRMGDHRQFDIGYRFANFSNAFIKHPNNTVNLHMLVFGYWY